MAALLLSLPEVAVTVMGYVPAGVPAGGGCKLLPPLHAGCNRISAETRQSRNRPNMRRRRRSRPMPMPIRANPGTGNQRPRKRRLNRLTAGRVTGRAVVVMFRLGAVGPFNVTEAGEKLHAAPVGAPEHVREMLLA